MGNETTTRRLDLESGTLAWDCVLERLSSFIEAWESGKSPPDIRDFLCDDPPALVRLTLVELVKADLEFRWKNNRDPLTIEQYAERFPELRGERGLPCDLIVEEFLVRRQLGKGDSPSNYLQRFANQAESLERLFAIHQTQNRTSTLRVKDERPRVEPGQSLDDFDLLETLGEGAFARVMLARQRSMQRLVALKVSHKETREAQTLAQLDHPNIVRVYDERFLPEQKIGLLYMEYVRGNDLAALVERARETPPSMRSGQLVLDVIDAALARHGEQPNDEMMRDQLRGMRWDEAVCWIGAQLASALDYAHRQGTLHRDLKPANILLSAEGIPKLADFNVSYSSKLEGATPEAFFGGSLGYMSPEQMEAYNPHEKRRADEVSAASDIYSLGVLLWELLTGRRPFADDLGEGHWLDSLAQMTRQRRQGIERETIEAIPKSYSAELTAILRVAMSPDPADRFVTAGDMSRRLQLSMKPEVRRVRGWNETSWSRIARRFPLISAVLIALLPNVVLSIANVTYDWMAIVKPRLPPEAQVVFLKTVITLIKSVHYGIGIPVGVWYALLVFREMRRPSSRERALLARHRCLRIGDMVFWVTMGAWCASGLVFPAWLDGTGVAFTPALYVHFFAAHLLCGLIAGIFCFFLLALVIVRVYFPRLAELREMEQADADDLARLRKRISWYSLGALIVPFLAALMLGVSESDFKYSFAGLAVLGAGLIYVANRISRDLQEDIDGLSVVARSSVDASRSSASRRHDPQS